MKLYAEIIVNSDALEIDRPFTYKVPHELEEDIKIGQIVKVPFGFGNRYSEGFVLSIKKEEEACLNFKVKEISSIENKEDNNCLSTYILYLWSYILNLSTWVNLIVDLGQIEVRPGANIWLTWVKYLLSPVFSHKSL